MRTRSPNTRNTKNSGNYRNNQYPSDIYHNVEAMYSNDG